MSGAQTGEATLEESGATGSNARGLGALALVVVTVLALLAAGLLFLHQRNLTDEPFSLANSGRPIPTDAERHQVVAVAEQFSLRMDGVSGDDPEGYVKRVSELLTTKQKDKFAKEFSDFQKLGIQKGLTGTGTILSSGLADMDEDSATVLVAHDSTVKATDGTTQRHYRWNVTLRKVDGKWLVDDFTPVT